MSDEPIRAREKCYPPVWLILIFDILDIPQTNKKLNNRHFHIFNLYISCFEGDISASEGRGDILTVLLARLQNIPALQGFLLCIPRSIEICTQTI